MMLLMSRPRITSQVVLDNVRILAVALVFIFCSGTLGR